MAVSPKATHFGVDQPRRGDRRLPTLAIWAPSIITSADVLVSSRHALVRVHPRKRMTVDAAGVIGDGDPVGTAVRYGYGSTEAFNRALRAVHGISPRDVRRDGGPLRTQPQLRFRLTTEGNTSMETRIADQSSSSSAKRRGL